MDCKNGQVCNVELNRCVAAPPDPTCASDDECPMERPICGEDKMCRSCVLDDECSSEVCREDGVCELPDRILYVRPSGLASGACSATTACDLQYALSLVADSASATIRLADGTYVLAQSLLVDRGRNVVLVGSSNAVVQRSSLGPAIVSSGASTIVTLRGFTLNRGVACSNATLQIKRTAFHKAALGTDPRSWIASTGCSLTITDTELLDSEETAIYVSNGDLTVIGSKIERSQRSGIEIHGAPANIQTSTITRSNELGVSSDAGSLVIHRSIVSYNRLGGIRSTLGTFDVVNNFVFRNGDPGASGFGGLHLDSGGNSRVQHNTIVFNDSDVNVQPPLAGGIYCRIGVTGTAYGNLVANNYRGNTSLPNAQTGGTCDFTYSLINESAFGLCDTSASVCRLVSGSAAVNAGMSLGIVDDYDGTARSDGQPDLGADELP